MALQALDDILEITQASSSAEVKIILQVDQPASVGNSEAQRFLVTTAGLETLVHLGQLDMADPQTLIDFVRFCAQVYPAQNYLLILWDHGNGWPIGNYGAYQGKAVIYDESSNNWLGVADGELKSALSEIQSILRKKLSLLVFDACLMAMVEVITEVSSNVDIMVASENTMPWDGLAYDEILTWLVNNPTATPQQLSQQIVISTSNFYARYNTTATLSAINLNKFNEALISFNTAAQILKNYAPNLQTTQIRNTVQTFAIEHDPPRAQDDYIDLLDFLTKTQAIITNYQDQKELNKIITKLHRAVIINRTTSEVVKNASGISVWFPDNYYAFKYQINEYKNLLWAKKTPWLHFLNDYFGLDDVKPAPVELKILRSVHKNNFLLGWSRAFDLSPVIYTLIRAQNTNVIFTDPANDFNNWETSGFIISNRQAYSPPYAFYSDEGNLITHYLQLKTPIALSAGGILEFYSYYVTEETYLNNCRKCDILYVEYSLDKNQFYVLDSFYGLKPYWSKHRYLLPRADSLYLRFRYQTDQTISHIGVYLDDIKISKFTSYEVINQTYYDTCFQFINHRRGNYDFYVLPQDSFGNIGYVSEALNLDITEYAEPYSIPSPFAHDCKIILDYPLGLRPTLFIYTLTGELIKEFSYQSFNAETLYWDGKNYNNCEVASGLYLVVLKCSNFKKIGKIAKVSR